MDPGDRQYRNQLVRLSDLTVVRDVIEGVTFENCQIVGPAVVVLLDGITMSGCNFEGDAESVVWPIGSRSRVMGAVGLKDCTIVGCQFQRIGIAIRDDQMDAMRVGFGLG